MTRPESGPAEPPHVGPPTPPRPSPALPAVDSPDVWHRLSPWMIAVKPVEQLPQLIPILVAIVVAGRSMPLLTVGLAAVAFVAIGVLGWATTRYQVTDEHVRVRTGLLHKKIATARRDRVRSVDLTASVPHRILGLKKVTIGTGADKSEAQVVLNALAAPYANTMHDFLMPTASGGTTDPATGPTTAADPAAGTPDGGGDTRLGRAPIVLARFRTHWLRFAPYSLTGLAAAAAVFGLGTQIAGEAGLFEDLADRGTAIVDRLRDVSLIVLIPVAALLVLLIGATLSMAAYVLSYWNFRLTRHPDGTLRVARGLISTASTSLDEKRIRGVHLHEPVLMRPVRGARLFAIATGSVKNPLLLPPAPFDEAVSVAGAVAGATAEARMPLTAHGRAALMRRLFRGTGWGLLLAAVPVAAAIANRFDPIAAAVIAPVLLAASIVFGWLRYRHLGHALSEEMVVISTPQIARHRYLIERAGVVGWSTRTSLFQRRRDLTTLTLTTAAGTEAYSMIDLDEDAATAVMATVSGDLLAPFLATTTSNQRTLNT